MKMGKIYWQNIVSIIMRAIFSFIIIAFAILLTYQEIICFINHPDNPYGNTVYFPSINIDETWESNISISNVDTGKITYQIKAFDKCGRHLIDLSSSLDPRESQIISRNSLPSETESMIVAANGSIVGYVNYTSSYHKQIGGVPAVQVISKELYFPSLYKGDIELKLIKLLNPNDTVANIVVRGIDINGHILDNHSLSLNPNESKTVTLNNLFKINLSMISEILVTSEYAIAGFQLLTDPNRNLEALPGMVYPYSYGTEKYT
jgi:hypothetical protein